jgi:1-acyl-sn-glycerol-3-phosphate acyltransferase
MSARRPVVRDPARLFDALRTALGFLLRLFFKQVEVGGRDQVPAEGGGILVSWHPNGLVDPGLILTQFPRRVIFGARHGLFGWPLLGFVLRSIGTVPIYRASDAATGDSSSRQAANRQSLDALAEQVARGSFSALFPEGTSHDQPHLVELKTGAARLYYRALELSPPGAPRPVILPVGLYYDQKHLFRSRALVRFEPPLEIPPELGGADPNEPEASRKDRAKKLTQEIERVLRDVIHATEDWSIHQTLHRGRKLVRAERARRAGADPGRPGIEEKALGFQRIRAGYYERLRTDPEVVQSIRLRVERYDQDLLALDLEDHELDKDPRLGSLWLPALLVLQVLFVLFLFPPLLLIGYLVNGPAALLLLGLCRIGARLEKDEATIKILIGALLFPLSWALAGAVAYFAHAHLIASYPALPAQPIALAVTVALLSAVGGAVALRYLHLAAETARAVRVRLTRVRRRAAVERLLNERGMIYEALMAMSEGLALPGTVEPDGRLR